MASQSASDTRTILIADDHPLFRTALGQAISDSLPDATLDTVGDFEQLSNRLTHADDVDLLLLDLNMPGAKGYAALVHARTAAPTLPIIVISAYEDPDVVSTALDHGASGFIPKSSASETLADAITAVLAGGEWVPADVRADRAARDSFSDKLATLTAQQQRVLEMLTEGMLNKQIAIDLAISEATVKAHITAILRKLAVSTRTQAVIAMQNQRWD
ncbi:response regulator transcription factor [Salinisphaera sp. USBA-960]|uniref:response regulator n=1 Tax=Salinisphaera orenii TaxID=856731 RepID=UPI000DBE0A95|nr:response regulator transcription factor [Salifodinibacter halophilus]NNC25844.1 response regulator transcription factor [Salifodinibacter halophilus]